mmetsp:Transcript_103192/g.186239  ORF Transcript_103192/g.186239 Transcript_103192/m.186239 type:complete len:502 (-) Transcript_103192:686-2191(-)
MCLLKRHPGYARHQILGSDHAVAFQHRLLVALELSCEDVPHIVQANTLTLLELPPSPDHAADLLHESLSIGGFLLLTCVRIHNNCQQHVEEDHDHDEREGPEKDGCLHEANLLHPVPVPVVAEHGLKARIQRPREVAEIFEVLPKEEDAIDNEAKEDKAKHQEEVHEVWSCTLQCFGHDGQSRLSREGLEETQHNDHRVDDNYDVEVLPSEDHIPNCVVEHDGSGLVLLSRGWIQALLNHVQQQEVDRLDQQATPDPEEDSSQTNHDRNPVDHVPHPEVVISEGFQALRFGRADDFNDVLCLAVKNVQQAANPKSTGDKCRYHVPQWSRERVGEGRHEVAKLINVTPTVEYEVDGVVGVEPILGIVGDKVDCHSERLLIYPGLSRGLLFAPDATLDAFKAQNKNNINKTTTNKSKNSNKQIKNNTNRTQANALVELALGTCLVTSVLHFKEHLLHVVQALQVREQTLLPHHSIKFHRVCDLWSQGSQHGRNTWLPKPGLQF